MSVFIWSFVWDFLYHLMPSFVQQILLNWLSKYNQTTCQDCLWFVSVEGWFFWGFSESLPASMLQGCTIHRISPREKSTALHHWWYRLYSVGLTVLVRKVRKAAQPCKNIWFKHTPCCLPEGSRGVKISPGIASSPAVCPSISQRLPASPSHRRGAAMENLTERTWCADTASALLLLDPLHSPSKHNAAPSDVLGVGWR